MPNPLDRVWRLPTKSRKAGADLRGRLERLGIYRASGHEHFNGSPLVIPILDAHGHATAVYGRKIRDDLRPGTPAHLYLPGPHRGVFNVAALAASKEIIRRGHGVSFFAHLMCDATCRGKVRTRGQCEAPGG